MLLSPQLPPLARRKILEYTTASSPAYMAVAGLSDLNFSSACVPPLRNAGVFSSRQNMQGAFNE
jgi:hypothetical protein